ncbi:hypothetical protein Cgig2_013086 [Carnegiea gigantea]|uniref:Uncharacterized protein n=1 Tax=Carnegiea gigantea TaxID=171969 RepID=A0A9Q1KQX3_9CARY|nr:hypothetical protein Cgig2_013086 [Carnegiea gigantea]
MMRAKTHRYEDERDGGDVSPLPDFSKSPLIITKKMISKTTQKSKKGKNSSALSSSSGIFRSDQMMIINRNNSKSKPRNLKLSSSLGSLMAALPLSPSPVCSSPTDSETIFSSPSSNLPCDYSRASGDFYTPTHQSSSVLSSMSFRKQEQSPKCLSVSTIYESVKDHNHRGGAFDSHGYAPIATYTYSPKSLASSLPTHHHDNDSSTTTTNTTNSGHVAVLPSVPDEMAGHGQKRRESGRAGQFTRSIPVRTDQDVVVEVEEHPTPVNRPKPYDEFLVEVQSHRRNVEHSAQRKALYTRLFDQSVSLSLSLSCKIRVRN